MEDSRAALEGYICGMKVCMAIAQGCIRGIEVGVATLEGYIRTTMVCMAMPQSCIRTMMVCMAAQEACIRGMQVCMGTLQGSFPAMQSSFAVMQTAFTRMQATRGVCRPASLRCGSSSRDDVLQTSYAMLHRLHAAHSVSVAMQPATYASLHAPDDDFPARRLPPWHRKRFAKMPCRSSLRLCRAAKQQK
jgi:hypothetical protein